MPYEEFLGWMNYFERRPVGWRDDDRTMKLLQVQGVKEKPWNVFHSLHAVYKGESNKNKDGTISGDNLKRSFLFNKMLSAKGGEKLEV